MSDVVRKPDAIAGEINFIKRQTTAICLNAAIEIGKLLVEAKSAVEYGKWGEWLENNVDYSTSTANNLMKLFNCYGDKQQLSAFDENCADIFGALTPSQALALTSLPEEKRVEYVQTHDVENESVREMKKQIEQLQQDLKQCENGYSQTLSLERSKLKDKDKLIKDKDKRIKELRNSIELETNKTKKMVSQINAANERADNAEKQLNDLISRGEPAPADMEAVRKEFEDEIIDLKKRLKNAENSAVQKFAVHFDMLQGEFNVLWSMIEEQQDNDTADKFRVALLKVLAAFENSLQGG